MQNEKIQGHCPAHIQHFRGMCTANSIYVGKDLHVHRTSRDTCILIKLRKLINVAIVRKHLEVHQTSRYTSVHIQVRHFIHVIYVGQFIRTNVILITICSHILICNVNNWI